MTGSGARDYQSRNNYLAAFLGDWMGDCLIHYNRFIVCVWNHVVYPSYPAEKNGAGEGEGDREKAA